MTDPKSSLRTLDFTHAALRELEKLNPRPGKNYRAIYQIRDEALLILVVKVGDRKEVYRRVK